MMRERHVEDAGQMGVSRAYLRRGIREDQVKMKAKVTHGVVRQRLVDKHFPETQGILEGRWGVNKGSVRSADHA